MAGIEISSICKAESEEGESFMYRQVLEQLEQWKAAQKRKPLLVQGARQVGKTWALKEFGRASFDAVAYVNFMENATVKAFFDRDLDPNRILQVLSLQTGVNAGDSNTLVILDEIQECPQALTSLKMFAEVRPEVPIVAAGSLLGVALHRGVSFPVGKVEHLFMYPLTFKEYLRNADEALFKLLDAQDTEILDAFTMRYQEHLKNYYFTGGLPEVVDTFLATHDYAAARSIQERLLYDYEHDFSKYADPILAEKIRLVWNSTPAQLGRENKKFIYSAVKTGARARGYEDAIRWLQDAGLVLKVNRISKPGLPLAAYEDKESFKIYLFDVGLLGAASRLDPAVLIEGNELFTEFKGALTENYVCQELVATGKVKPYYWSAENSRGEVDFVYDTKNQIMPVEVKAEINLRSKSLRAFVEKYGLERGLRLSLAGFDEQGWLVNMPLYATSMLPDWPLKI